MEIQETVAESTVAGIAEKERWQLFPDLSNSNKERHGFAVPILLFKFAAVTIKYKDLSHERYYSTSARYGGQSDCRR